MSLAALAFALGAALLQLQASLPPLAWAWLLPGMALLSCRWKFLVIPTALLAGFLWAGACAHWRMADWLAPALEGRDVEVTGVVSSLPAVGERSVRFEFDVEAAGDATLPKKLLLAWYGNAPGEDAAPAPVSVHPGERWLLTVRLRRPHGLVNPHGFDYEAWLLERGIGATGYVRNRTEPKKISMRNSILDRIEQARESVRDRILAYLGPTPAAAVLAALAVGDQRAISTEEWRLFARTGVTHLMSISGLHVTLVSGLLAALAAALWRRVPWLALRAPARKAAAVAAIFGALGYTLLAGFGVPAQRTFWMVTVVAAALWAGRIATPWRTLALALGAIVIADPWAPLAPGLWLSFGAVLLIFYAAAGWNAPESKLVQWGRIQWAITLGLAPAVLLLFGQVSVAGPLANAVAIPVVSAVVTPLALVAALLPFDVLLDAGAWLVEALMQFLEWCAALPGAVWTQHAPAPWSVAFALAGVAWILAPRGVPWRACGLALMAPAFALPAPAPHKGEAWITVFDVGQGLAVLARTRSHAALYDAGPAWSADADGGSRVVLPALAGAGVPRLDLVVISHEDADHAGGALSVLEGVETDALASSLAPGHPLLALAPAPRRCAAGESWTWEGVRFEFLHPAALAARRNNNSCVLRIASAGGSLLLTGDIEAPAELQMLQNDVRIKSDVLVVPHHGSRTSSTAAFIAAVAPGWAVVPVGYRNRFGHPHPLVLKRYAAAGVNLVRTDRDGAVRIRLHAGATELATERALRGRYWLEGGLQ